MQRRPFKSKSGTRIQLVKIPPLSPVKSVSRFRDREKSKKKMDPSFVDPSDVWRDAKLEAKSARPKPVSVKELKRLKTPKIIPKQFKLKSTLLKSRSLPGRKRADIKGKYGISRYY